MSIEEGETSVGGGKTPWDREKILATKNEDLNLDTRKKSNKCGYNWTEPEASS